MTNWKNSCHNYPVSKQLANGIVTGLMLCFPLYLWVAGWRYPTATAMYLSAIGGLRLVTVQGKRISFEDGLTIIMPLVIALLVLLKGSRAGLYYPAVINLGFLMVFYMSLSGHKNFIQQIAEKTNRISLNAEGICYTRKVTLVWCGFFMVNILISTTLAWYEQLELWTVYNGVVSYLVMGVLFLGERIVRPKTIQGATNTSNKDHGLK